MPRHQRKLSKTSIYHIMLRGFGSNEEKQRLLEDILVKQNEFEFSIYAYCLMDNHVHIVINSKDTDISTIMKGIAIRYAYFYNVKYNRIGHVFQDRFKSETVEDERYLMAVIRYIHNNPVKAKIVNRPEDYQWSTYRQFFHSVSSTVKVDTQYILSIMAKEQQAAITEFIRFSQEEDPLSYLDCENEERYGPLIKDESILKIISPNIMAEANGNN